MKKFFLALFLNPGDIQSNNAVQGFHFENNPLVQWVFSCERGNESDCPVKPAQVGVTIYPTLVFMYEVSKNKFIEAGRLTGIIDSKGIQSKLQELQNWQPDTGGGGQSGVIDLGKDGGGGLPGLNILGFKLPWWLTLLGLYVGYRYGEKRKWW